MKNTQISPPRNRTETSTVSSAFHSRSYDDVVHFPSQRSYKMATRNQKNIFLLFSIYSSTYWTSVDIVDNVTNSNYFLWHPLVASFLFYLFRLFPFSANTHKSHKRKLIRFLGCFNFSSADSNLGHWNWNCLQRAFIIIYWRHFLLLCSFGRSMR